MCVHGWSHLCLHCALASGAHLTLESREADRDRPIRINYSGHTWASGTLHTYSQDNRDTQTHTHKALTFRMNVSCVILSMTKRTCDDRLLLIAKYKQIFQWQTQSTHEGHCKIDIGPQNILGKHCPAVFWQSQAALHWVKWICNICDSKKGESKNIQKQKTKTFLVHTIMQWPEW